MVARTNGDLLTRPEVMSDDRCESHRADSTEPEGLPSASGTERPATPNAEGIAAEEDSEASASQPSGEISPSTATTTPSSRKKRSKAAKKAARAAAEAGNSASAASGEQEPAQ